MPPAYGEPAARKCSSQAALSGSGGGGGKLAAAAGGGALPTGSALPPLLTRGAHDGGHPLVNIVALGPRRAVAGGVQADLRQLFLYPLGASAELGHRAARQRAVWGGAAAEVRGERAGRAGEGLSWKLGWRTAAAAREWPASRRRHRCFGGRRRQAAQRGPFKCSGTLRAHHNCYNSVGRAQLGTVTNQTPSGFQWRVTRTLVRHPYPAVPPQLTGRSPPHSGLACSAPCPSALPSPLLSVDSWRAAAGPGEPLLPQPLPAHRSPPFPAPAPPSRAPSAACATRSAATLSNLLGDPPSRGITAACAVPPVLPPLPLVLPPLGPHRQGEAPTTGCRAAIVCFSLHPVS